MKIGIISDIHDDIPNLLKSFEILKKQKVSRVFFCGDLVSCFTIDYFRNLKIPVKAVYGNNEGDKDGIIERIKRNKVDFEYAPKRKLMWDVELEGQRLAVFHGHQPEITHSLVHSRLFDYVITGHTHRSHVKKVKKTLWINPGSVCGVAGLDIAPIKPSLAILDLSERKAVIIKI
mgnify:CR=1 FL=1